MTYLLSAVAFFILMTVLVLIHEWGHYYAAKKSGVVVEEFGFGLPPRAKALFKRDGTVFSLNWIPFGGFVRLKGENAVDLKSHKAKGSFGAASVTARVVILCAGVFMNFVLAVAILTIGFGVGRWVPTYSSLDEMVAASERGVMELELAVQIADIISGGGAAKVGVPQDVLLVSVDGQKVTMPKEVSAAQEGKSTVVYKVASGENYTVYEEFTVNLTDGKAGVVLAAYPLKLDAPMRLPHEAFGYALRESWIMLKQTVLGIGNLFSSLFFKATVPEGITGIVGIAQMTHASVQEGFTRYMRLVALLSLSLAALNILPFPALDGGRLLFVIAEVISRRPVNRKFELATNGLGFLFLIGLILVITYHDIARLF